MTNEEQILKNEVMMRVRFIYGVKALPRVFVPKIALLVSLVALAGFFVSMPHVVHNMPSIFEVENFTRFFVVAFLNTKLTIQAISLGTFILLGYMVRDIVKVLKTGNLRTVAV